WSCLTARGASSPELKPGVFAPLLLLTGAREKWSKAASDRGREEWTTIFWRLDIPSGCATIGTARPPGGLLRRIVLSDAPRVRPGACVYAPPHLGVAATLLCFGYRA